MPVYVTSSTIRMARAGRHRHDGAVPGGGRSRAPPRVHSASRTSTSPASTSSSTPTCTSTTAAGTTSSPAGRSTSSVGSSDARSEDDYTIREWFEAPGVGTCRSTASSSCWPGSGSSLRRVRTRACRWSSSRAAGVQLSSAATWRSGSELTSRTRRPAAGARARPRACLARARARAVATTPCLSHHAGALVRARTIRAMADAMDERTVSDVMLRNPKTLPSE